MNISTSPKPYLIRAFYDWITDNSLTAYIEVYCNESTQVPKRYVQDNKIVLNISQVACQKLHMGNDIISFRARFSGKEEQIYIPVGHVLSIFAKENGEGMGFELTEYIEPEKTQEKREQTVEGNIDSSNFIIVKQKKD